jgi:hypothetical protein
MIWSHLHGDMQGEWLLDPLRSEELWAKRLSEIPCRVSSDPHEWRNELGAVSATHSAKMQYL